MVVIPEEYYAQEVEVKLTRYEIESIIDALEVQPHNIYEFMNLKELVSKLREAKNGEEH